jgi:FkbM family methyltransferase
LKKIFFDVGANFGTSSIHKAKSDPETIVYAFEPTPELILHLKTQTFYLKNYNVVGKAVSDYEGTATFNVSGLCDWGCSSLLEFSDKSKTEWPGRTDFVVSKQIQVDVIRLDNFIIENNIDVIDYFHCDTQGSDLDVLYGLGEKISIIKEGTIEAAEKQDILYKNQNTVIECIEFLKMNNFEVVSVSSNDPEFNEANIHFKNKLYL